ncbi:helix-turn-helix domain-containing protein [Pseudovibrio ascidiaceicola]|uniref:helix-turn-helix domain-containing protein n=1 Tax=Pseudovibrio ascidiaceicola TaxID=285279 RepID=UPI003D36EBB2
MNDSELIDHLRCENDILLERIKELEDALIGTVSLPLEWELTRYEQRLMSTLINREFLTKEGALVALYDDLGKDRPEEKIVDVYVCKLRAKLKDFDISIHTRWGEGYYIEKEERLKLKKLLEQEDHTPIHSSKEGSLL